MSDRGTAYPFLRENAADTCGRSPSVLHRLGSGLLLLFVLVPAARGESVLSGRELFRLCVGCHEIGPDAKNKIGPVLNGLDGRKAGETAGYAYSKAMTSSGIIWSEQTFVEYIMHPQHVIPGIKMTFAGTKNREEAQDLWAYIRSIDHDGSSVVQGNSTAAR